MPCFHPPPSPSCPPRHNLLHMACVALCPWQRSCGLRRGLAGSRPAPAPKPRRGVSVSAAGLTPEYGYVLGSVAFSAALVQWQAVRVALARREFGVKYPQMYAEGTDAAAMKFNCTQRAHQNTLETLPAMIALVCLLGLQHPVAAAGLGMVWNIGRVVYTFGYSTGDPNQRLPGVAIAGLTYVASIAATAYAGGQMAGLLP